MDGNGYGYYGVYTLIILSVAIIPSYHADYTVLHFTSAQTQKVI